MPEGHTLHRLAGELTELVGQEVAASSPQGRLDPAPVDGAVVIDVQAHGKHLLVATSAGSTSTCTSGCAGSGCGSPRSRGSR